jgi:hypothetical protein
MRERPVFEGSNPSTSTIINIRMNMRDILNLVESPTDIQLKWWINIRTGEIRSVSRAHGDETTANPAAFGVSPADVERIKAENPDLDPEGDGWGELSWWELVRFEAMKNGWVRAGSYQEGSEDGAPYVYAASLRMAQMAISLMMKKGWIIDACDVEITDPTTPVEGHGDFYELRGMQLKQFMLRRR